MEFAADHGGESSSKRKAQRQALPFVACALNTGMPFARNTASTRTEDFLNMKQASERLKTRTRFTHHCHHTSSYPSNLSVLPSTSSSLPPRGRPAWAPSQEQEGQGPGCPSSHSSRSKLSNREVRSIDQAPLSLPPSAHWTPKNVASFALRPPRLPPVAFPLLPRDQRQCH